ncbi:vWA domain-containing protein [Rhodanobacter spathiphylli]|uniref:Lipoprotein n=1 Tax=Rhodanobacter spathiphylli B39 TaxID=1163407 RepID=I4W704_9GAMM|nr:VWA domain-containing protein [Rhodanobacter spathiphylli]EIL95245.1 lipoprotein [Rhodanobacter spathiphylli B39]
MKLKALLRSLLLALLVIVTGCSVSRPATDTHARKNDGASTPTAEPVVEPAPTNPQATAQAKSRSDGPSGSPADRAAPAGRAVPMPAAPPAPPAPPALAEVAAMSYNAQSAKRMAYMPSPTLMQPMPGDVNTENYTHRDTNPVQLVSEQPVSTFSIDVDTGSYTNVRRMLGAGQLPPADAVRAEEFINYFDYGYTPPASREQPFSVTTELAPAPWNAKRQLLLVGIQGYRVPAAQIPASNLVFLIDTSGSMDEADKLPLLQASLKQLVRQLRRQDRVAIVSYAGYAGVVLPSTAGDQHATIDAAIDRLSAGGSTNGGAGIELAYAQAEQGFIKGGVNRVILATDGDFNVGTVNEEALKTTIEDHRKSGVALTTLGFGEGNYNDAMAVMLADVGNGSHHYIDSLQEGRRVLVDEMSATLLTIARDVKIQVEFNPAQVQEYRLIGYEKRMLKREDFNNDKVDAGEIGAGANVTAIYEITPKGSNAARIDPLRYGKHVATGESGNELAFLRLRYKLPGQSDSKLVEQPIAAHAEAQASERLRYAAAVAAFADALRGGKYLDGYGYTQIAKLANDARGDDADGYRAGFVQLVKLASGLATRGHDGASDTAAR